MSAHHYVERGFANLVERLQDTTTTLNYAPASAFAGFPYGIPEATKKVGSQLIWLVELRGGGFYCFSANVELAVAFADVCEQRRFRLVDRAAKATAEAKRLTELAEQALASRLIRRTSRYDAHGALLRGVVCRSVRRAGTTGQTAHREPYTDDEWKAMKALRDFVPVRAGALDLTRVERFIAGATAARMEAYFGAALRTPDATIHHKGDRAHCQWLTALFVDADFKKLGEVETRRLLVAVQEVEGKIVNLTIENGAAVAPIVSQLERRQTEREGLLTAIAAAEARQSVLTDRRIVELAVLTQVDQWRMFLTSEPDVAGHAAVLARVPAGALKFTPLPEQKAYRFEGDASSERLLGQVGLPPCVASRMPASWNQIAGWLKQIDSLHQAA